MSEDLLNDKIIELLSKSERPVSTFDISSQLDVPWHSVQVRCLRLQIDNKLNGFKVGRMNLWEIRK